MKKENKEKVIQYTKDYYKWSLMSDGTTIERYVDYRDEFPSKAIDKILNSDNPEECLWETVGEWDLSCDDWQYETDFFEGLEAFCKANSIDILNAIEVVRNNFYWSYPDSFLNPEFNAVIQIDTGDGNEDFTLHNILNYAKNHGYCNGLEERAGLYWLAKQQGRLGLLKREIRKADGYSGGNCEESPFVSSTITELENLCTHMGAVTFLVKMHLQDAIKILQAKREHKDDFDKYNPLETKGSPFGYITLSKDTETGIYDSWQGGGSLMEITLEKEVKLPIHLIFSITTDKDIQEVYGMSDECWQKTLLKIA